MGGLFGAAPYPTYMVVATDTMHRRVHTLLQDAIDDNLGVYEGVSAEEKALGARATVADISGGLAQINIQGPRSRELMQKLSPGEDFGDSNFPFRAARSIAVGLGRVLVTRITYVGELGYELYVPSEQAAGVYARVVEVGEEYGLTHVGLAALGSLRLEKGYRDYGHDMDNCDSVLEVGLGFACDFDKPGGFRGKDAVLAEKAANKIPHNRLVSVLLQDPDPMLYHAEVVYRDGVVVGDIRAGSYGHTLGGSVGLSMVAGNTPGGDGTVPVSAKFIREGQWEVDVAGVRYPATVSLRPMWDPKNERIKA